MATLLVADQILIEFWYSIHIFNCSFNVRICMKSILIVINHELIDNRMFIADNTHIVLITMIVLYGAGHSQKVRFFKIFSLLTFIEWLGSYSIYNKDIDSFFVIYIHLLHIYISFKQFSFFKKVILFLILNFINLFWIRS